MRPPAASLHTMLRALVSQPLVVGGKQRHVLPAPHTSRRRPGQVAVSCRAAACGRGWRCQRDAARYGRCSAHVCRVATLDARAGAACEEPEQRAGGHEASGVRLEQEIARLSRLIGQLASAGGTLEQARSALPAAVPCLAPCLRCQPVRARACVAITRQSWSSQLLFPIREANQLASQYATGAKASLLMLSSPRTAASQRCHLVERCSVELVESQITFQ